MYHAAPKVDAAVTEAREYRSAHMQDAIISLDPDRNRVVQIYGEDTTSAIERASML